MAETPETPDNESPGGNFILDGQVSQDLVATLGTSSPVSTLLRDKLKIVQECNYFQQIAAGAGSSEIDSLGSYINQNLRGNTGITSYLKSATRLYFNPAEGMSKMSSHVIRRLGSELNHPLNVAYVKNTVGYLQSSNAPFGVNQNELIFTRPCEILICFNAAWGVWSGSGTYDGLLPPEIPSAGGENPGVPEPVWRFSATGTNRTVTVQPAFKISGSLSTGPGEMKLIPSTLTFQEHDIYPGTLFLQTCILHLEVLRGSGAYGRVEKLQLTVDRTPYVAHFGQLTDALGLFKTTTMNNDDANNFVDVIEL